MMPRSRSLSLAAALCTLATTFSARAADMTQPPQLAQPQRASLAGEYGKVAFGAADVDRGVFSLPAPLVAPTDRGPLPISVFPTYSPDGGVSEWGMGWSTALSFTRTRILGTVDYATDDLSGPWGRMVRGTDGNYYAQNLGARVVVAWNEPTIVATLPSGDRLTYGGGARFVGAGGTYQWLLTDAVTVTGQHTHLTWTTNASGRSFLQSVQYGGIGTDYQYELDYSYEGTPYIFVSYLSGVENTVDQRVHQVTVRARNPATGSFDERWHYSFTYQEEGLGAGFYLTQIDQTFASGQVAPPIKYSYRLASGSYATRAFTHVPSLDKLLTSFGNDVIQSTRSTPIDIDNDGRIDLEESQANYLLQQTDSGWVSVAAPAMPSTASQLCRHKAAVTNQPRLLSSMLDGTESVRVLGSLTNATHSATELDLCERDGTERSSVVLAGYWQPSANVKLVDLDRDRKPDLVRVDYGMVTVLPNISSSNKLAFDTPRATLLTPQFTPTASYVQDFNGDGLPDLLARTNDTITVWFGTGHFEFVGEGQTFQVFSDKGLAVGNFDRFTVNFVDANRDGMMDLLLTQTGLATLYVNDGFHFREVVVPALDDLPSGASAPVVGDLAATGNDAISMVYRNQAYSVDLDDVGVGLMSSADDGRGNVLQMTYARAAAAPNLYTRHSVIASLNVVTVGQDAVNYTYAYAAGSVQSQGKYLLGYGKVTRSSAQQTQTLSLLNNDDEQGVLQSSITQDTLTPSLHGFELDTYDSVVYQGVPWLRLNSQRKGWADASNSQTVEERSDFLAYEDEVCPSQVQLTKAVGTLTTITSRANPVQLAGALHCLAETTSVSGQHADSRWDFVQQEHTTRDDFGLPLSVEQLGSRGTLVERAISYDARHEVATFGAPGRGTSTFTYDPSTHVLAQVVEPNGVTHTVTRDPLTDRAQMMVTDRGAIHFTDFFRFDGQERLVKHWNDLGQASESTPVEQYGYRYATATLPGATTVATLVEAALGSVQTTVELQTGNGEEIATASWQLDGWSFGPLTSRKPNQGETSKLIRDPLAGADPSTLDLPTLFAGARTVSDRVVAPSGVQISTTDWFYPSQQRVAVGSLTLSAGQLLESTVENGTYTTAHTVDSGLRPTSLTDAGGARWVYHYDALDRLRAIDMPDGRSQRVYYDGYGHVSRIERDGVANIDQSYDPVSGLVVGQTVSAPDGTPVRGTNYGYDAIGRKTGQLEVDLVGNSTSSFSFYYDGATPDAPNLTGQRGLLTAVTGDGFVKTMSYRGDGKLLQRNTALTGWQTVASSFTYGEDGAPLSTSTTVTRADGVVLGNTTLETHHDAAGRVSAIQLNGAGLASLSYNPQGQLRNVALSTGDSITYSFDPYTTAEIGQTRTAAQGWTSSDSFAFNNRGLVGSETLGMGAQQTTRSYSYSPARYLISSTDDTSQYQYGYDATGLVTDIQENGVDRPVVQGGNTLTAGSSAYTLDSIGRTIARDDLELTYGPNGQLAQAQRGADQWTFKYDDAGQRLLKLHNGAPVAGYVEEGYLDDSGLTTVLPVAKDAAGVIENGTFDLVPLDRLGSMIGDTDGTQNLASPYGQRSRHGRLAAIIDYAHKGYDADLGIVRMGDRDYDPALGRFWSADPLFLGSLDHCAKSSAQCNLFGYAGGDPIDFTDPTGHEAWWFQMLFGTRVHQAISDNYAAVNVTHQLYINRAINTIVNDQNPGAGPQKDGKLRPDIVDMGVAGTHAGAGVVEIKAIGSEAEARKESLMYQALLRAGGVDVPLLHGNPGMQGHVTVMGIEVGYMSPAPGVIVYWPEKVDKQVIKAAVLTAVAAGAGAAVEYGKKALSGVEAGGKAVEGAAAGALLPLNFLDPAMLQPVSGSKTSI